MLFFTKFFKDVFLKVVLLSSVIIPLLFMHISTFEVIKIFLLGVLIILFIDVTCAIILVLSMKFINLLIFRVLMIGVPIVLILYKNSILEPLRILIENYYALCLIDIMLLLLLNLITNRFYKFCVLKSYEKRLFSKYSMTNLFASAPILMLEITDIARNFSYYAILICRSLLIEIVLFYNIYRIDLLGEKNGFY